MVAFSRVPDSRGPTPTSPVIVVAAVPISMLPFASARTAKLPACPRPKAGFGPQVGHPATVVGVVVVVVVVVVVLAVVVEVVVVGGGVVVVEVVVVPATVVVVVTGSVVVE